MRTFATVPCPRVLLVALLLCFTVRCLADDREARAQSDADVVAACLASWGDHPFSGVPRFRVLASSVKVFGIGQDVTDDTVTDAPAVVLIKPAVNVLGKENFRLLNPNGWYCFQSAVTVLAKSVITAHCRAHLASSIDGVAVAGGNQGTDGVTVLGKAVVRRVGCKE